MIQRKKQLLAGTLAALMLLLSVAGCSTKKPPVDVDTSTGDGTENVTQPSDPVLEPETLNVVDSGAPAFTYHFDFLSTPVDGSVYDEPYTYGWSVRKGKMTDQTVEESAWGIKMTGPELTIESEKDVALPTDQYPSFRMRILNQTGAAKATLYFVTDKNKGFGESKKLTIDIQPNDSIYREYMFDMTGVDTWEGTLDQVRLVLTSENENEAGKLYVDYFSFSPTNLSADVVYDFSETLAGVQNIANASSEGKDLLRLVPTGEGVSFETTGDLNLKAVHFNYFKIGVQNANTANRMRVSFTTTDSPEWSEDKSVLLEDLKGIDDGLITYAFYMKSCELWRGTVQRIRVTFEDSTAGGGISIPGMGLYTGSIFADEIYDFGKGIDGWQADGNATVSAADDTMTVTVSGDGGAVISPDMELYADELGYLTLRLKNDTASSSMRIQWMNEGDTEFNDVKSQNVVITPNSDTKEYVVPLIDHQRWTGKVTKLRITPALYTTTGNVQISSLTFSQNADASFTGRMIPEGFLEVAFGWTYNNNGGQVRGVEHVGDMDKLGVDYGMRGQYGSIEITNNGPIDSLKKGAPVEAWHSVPAYTDGYIQWPVEITVNNLDATGTALRLINTQTGHDAIRLTIDKGVLTAARPDGQKKLAVLEKNKLLRFTLYMNMSAHTYDLWLDNTIVEKDVPFTSAESFDRVYIGTDGSHKMVFGYTGNMFRVNEFYDVFYYYNNGPFQTFQNEGEFKSDRYDVVGNPRFESGYLVVDNSAAVTAKFVPGSNVIETNVVFKATGNGQNMVLDLKDGDKVVAGIRVEGKNILYLDGNGNQQVLWTDIMDTAEYSLKIRVYTELRRMEYSINGCSSKNGGWENVFEPAVTAMPEGVNTLNSLTFSTGNSGAWNIRSIRILDYTPSTVPTVEAVNNPESGYVGVNVWSHSHCNPIYYQKSQRIHDKESVLGYFNNLQREAVDWQIKYLAENAVDFVAFFYNFIGQMEMERTFLDYAEYNQSLKYAMIFEGPSAPTEDDLVNSVWPYLRERMMRNPNYLTFEGKPVVFIYNDLLFDDAKALTTLRQLAKEAGWEDLIMVNVSNVATRTLDAALEHFQSVGYDYVTNYWQSFTPSTVRRDMNTAKRYEIDYIPSVGIGGDSRCWYPLSLEQSPHDYFKTTPSEFYNTLMTAKEKMAELDESSLASKMVFIENWGEFGEGHCIMPFGSLGFNYINQIRRVFGPEDQEQPINKAPSGKLDNLFSKGWNTEQLTDRGFEAGSDGWTADEADIIVRETNEFYYLKNNAKVSKRASADIGITQDITGSILKNGKGAVYDMSAYLKSTVDATTTAVTLVVTDSVGVHSYTYNGTAVSGTCTNSSTQIKVDWTGELISAVLTINGDTQTDKTFTVDECRFQLVRKQYYTANKVIVIH